MSSTLKDPELTQITVCDYKLVVFLLPVSGARIVSVWAWRYFWCPWTCCSLRDSSLPPLCSTVQNISHRRGFLTTTWTQLGSWIDWDSLFHQIRRRFWSWSKGVKRKVWFLLNKRQPALSHSHRTDQLLMITHTEKIIFNIVSALLSNLLCGHQSGLLTWLDRELFLTSACRLFTCDA